MTPEQFAYWLQGFYELESGTPLTKREQIIKDHLKEVFHKKTPDRNFKEDVVPLPYIPQQLQPYPQQLPWQGQIIC